MKTIKDLQSAPDAVGVFVNEEAGVINELVEQVGLNFVQLHGTESPELCSQIRRHVIKALHLHSMDDMERVRTYRETTWRILLDTPTTKWGGAGKTHDWNLAHAVALDTSIFLAGGLTPENVGDAITQVRPWGVDVSSGVETNGSKDSEKIRTFIQNARSCYLRGQRQQSPPR